MIFKAAPRGIAMTLGRCLGLLVGLALLVLAAEIHRGTAAEILTLQPGLTIVKDAVGDMQLANCERAQPRRPCTLGVGMSRTQPGWIDIESAEIRQGDADAVELSMTVHAPIPKSPSVPVLIYYWQFQDGCNEPSPSDKDGANVLWNGRSWSAHWFSVESCNPRQLMVGNSIPFSFDGSTVTLRARLADLVTRGGVMLRWFAATRLLSFKHPVFLRTLPVDTAPDVVAIDPAHPGEPHHPQESASWIPR
jgi:hypothetical protein